VSDNGQPVPRTHYWDRALAAIDRKRSRLHGDAEDDKIWRELERLQWLEEFARRARGLAEDAEVF